MTDSYDVVVIGAGPAGETRRWPGGRRRPQRRHRGTRAGRRRVLLLGLHPVQDADPAGRRAGRGPARARRRRGRHRHLDMRRRLRPARLHDLALATTTASCPWLDEQGHRRSSAAPAAWPGSGPSRSRPPTAPSAGSSAARAVVLATGTSRPHSADPRPARGRALGQPRRHGAKELPRRLLVLGGGAVGAEMAQAFKRLGCEEVTVLEGARPAARARGAVRRRGAARRVRGRGHHRASPACA